MCVCVCVCASVCVGGGGRWGHQHLRHMCVQLGLPAWARRPVCTYSSAGRGALQRGWTGRARAAAGNRPLCVMHRERLQLLPVPEEH